MVNLSDNLGYVPVVRIETSDTAIGGNETNQPNKALKELASRDAAILELLGGTDAVAQATTQTFTQLGVAATAQGRLTLSAGTPVPSVDVTNATTLYYTPYNGDYIALYNTSESRWELRQFTERSLSLSGLEANTNYDIFASWNGTVVSLTSVAWTTSGAGTSTRSAITQINGIWVRSSNNSQRLLGTIRTNGTVGQCDDSAKNRTVANVTNTVPRTLALTIAGTYSYTVGSFRASANGSQPNASVNIVTPLAGTSVNVVATLNTRSENTSTLTCPTGSVGLGVNQTTVNDGSATDRPATADLLAMASFGSFSLTAPGYNYIAVLELGFDGNGTTTGDFTVNTGALQGLVSL